jgi:ribosome maturation factor RimP
MGKVLQSKLEEIVSPLCARRGLELVQVQLGSEKGGGVLRILIDRPREDQKPGSGVDIDDCQHLSQDLSAILEEDPDIIPGPFRLEVSSPGIERPLVKAEDYVRFEGREATLKTREPIEGRRSFRGILAGVDAGSVRLDLSGEILSIPLEVVTKAHLVHRF